MKREFNLDNVKTIITEVFNMTLEEISCDSVGREYYHYYKSVCSLEFDMLREYRFVVSLHTHSYSSLKVNYSKLINAGLERESTKYYNVKDGWNALMYDFIMRSFGTMDSYTYDDIEYGLDYALRERKIDKLLEQ